MNLELLTTAVMHTIYGSLRSMVPAPAADRDRGAVSLEQVLWFVAAGVAVAVVAGVLWNKIKAEADKPVNAPSAP
jgi:hypothetical protein